MDKVWSIHTLILFSQMDTLTPATTWMNMDDMMLSEISQSQKDKHCDSTFMRALEKSNP